MKKILIMSLMAVSMIGLIGCQEVVKDDDLNLTISSDTENKDSSSSVSVQSNNPYVKNYTDSFKEIEAFGEDVYVPYEDIKDNELIKDIKLILTDYWLKDGDIAVKNGVEYVYDKGIVPFDSEKIDEITSAKEGIMTQLKDKEIVDVVIKEVSWQKSLVAKELDKRTLFVKYRLVDSEGVEYSTIAFGSLDFGVYSDNGVIKLMS